MTFIVSQVAGSVPVTLNDAEGHLPILSLEWYFSYSCAVSPADQVSSDSASRALSAVAELLVAAGSVRSIKLAFVNF